MSWFAQCFCGHERAIPAPSTADLPHAGGPGVDAGDPEVEIPESTPSSSTEVDGQGERVTLWRCPHHGLNTGSRAVAGGRRMCVGGFSGPYDCSHMVERAEFISAPMAQVGSEGVQDYGSL